MNFLCIGNLKSVEHFWDRKYKESISVRNSGINKKMEFRVLALPNQNFCFYLFIILKMEFFSKSDTTFCENEIKQKK